MSTVAPDRRASAPPQPSLSEQPEREKSRSWSVLIVALIAQTLVVLDISVVNTALPTIGESLRLDSHDLQWLVTAYLLMSGGGLLLGGRIADLLPRRRVFLAGLAVFTTASLLAGFAGQCRRSHRRPRHPGTQRRRHDSSRALAHHDHLHGTTAREGPRPVGSGRQHGHRRGRVVRRRPDDLGGLADGFLGQRARRRGRFRRLARPAAQGPGRACGPAPARPSRRRRRHCRSRNTVARHPGGERVRLDLRRAPCCSSPRPPRC